MACYEFMSFITSNISYRKQKARPETSDGERNELQVNYGLCVILSLRMRFILQNILNVYMYEKILMLDNIMGKNVKSLKKT